jgi:hypothetical protein
LEAGGVPSLAGDFEGGTAIVPGAIVAGEEELLTGGELGVCADGLEETVGIALGRGRKASTGKVIELTTDGSSWSFT